MASKSFGFDGLQFFFIAKKIGKLRLQILTEKIVKFGGNVVSDIDENTTHVLFHSDVSLQDGLKFANIERLSDTIQAVKIDWVSYCIMQNKILDTSDFKVQTVETRVTGNHVGESTSETLETDHYNENKIKISGTSHFSNNAKLLTDSHPIIIKKTYFTHSKYGLGIYSLFSDGEKQIGWIPEKKRMNIEKMMTRDNFQVKLQSVVSKKVTPTFEKIDIVILCCAK